MSEVCLVGGVRTPDGLATTSVGQGTAMIVGRIDG